MHRLARAVGFLSRAPTDVQCSGETMGKIRTFLSGLIIISCFLVSTAQQKGCLDENPPYDIAFLVDSSSSIGTRDFREVKKFMHTFVDGLDIDTKNVQVGLAQFSTDPHKEFLIGDYANKADLLKKIDNLPYRTGGTYMGKAMDFLKDNYFTSAGGSRINEKVPQIVMVVTDGDSVDDIKEPAGKLREKGIIIFAIGVGPTNMTELKSIANTPPERFVVKIDNYQALQGLTATMKETVCILMRDQGKAIAPRFADVFVLVDSLAQSETRQIRELLNQLAVQLNVGDGSHKIALAQFGEKVVKEFLYNDYKSKEQARGFINRFEPRPNGERKLGEAIDYVRTHFLKTVSGCRISEGYKQYLLVLRTGNSADSTLRAIRTMENEDVTVIDIRLEANLRYLLPTLRTFQVDQNIIDVATNISKRIQKTEVFNVTGDCTSAQVADIVFIVDESDSITVDNFLLVKRFIHRTISGLDVNFDNVRVGMVLYSWTPSSEFYLDSFNNKRDILNYIKILPYRGGGTATGAALTFAKDNLFTKRRGSRKGLGVKQVAVVITDGESQDDVTAPAAELRRSGVTVYALGVKDASVEELKKIGSYPARQFVFNVESFEMLTSLEKSLRKSLCKVVVDRGFEKNNRFNLKQGCVNTEEADIYFLLDNSGSTRADFEDVKKFILGVLQLFNIGPNQVRVGVVNVDHDPTLQFNLTEHENRVSLEAAVQKILQPYGGTETGKALTYVANLFSEAKASRSAKVQEILIVITDKKSKDEVGEPAAELRIQGVSVYAIGLKNANQEELLRMTDDTAKQFYVSNYDALNTLKTEIITDICSQEACKNKVADIMFLIDGSSSIYGPDFNSMKTFITKVVTGTVIGKDNVHTGVVQYSDNPRDQFPLDKYYSQDEVEKAIDSITQLTGNTYTGKALSFISKYFDKSNGGRPDVPQFLVVITDGEAHDAVAAPAKAIRDKGVTIFSIGVGQVNTTQLWEISGTQDKVYVERNFEALQSIDKNLQFKLCSPETDCPSNPLADVIFLVQCTKRIRNQEFDNIRKFLISVVNSIQIGDNLIRFGVIVYSGTPYQFSLNQYNNKRELVEAIETLKLPIGNVNTDRALGYSVNYFKKENGGRHERGIPQMLFVITDGDAKDQDNLRARADELQSKHINVYGIGVARAQERELEIITKNKNKIFHVDNYEGLKGLQKNISSVLCKVTKPECHMEVADLVFLIDGSESIKEGPWKTMISFLLNVVDRLRISPELFRIGIAQFSSSYRKEFYLNEYNDVEGVKSAIEQIKQISEGTLIGKALSNVVEFFDKSKGSRRESHIPQNLVLITDGDSSDSVIEPAKYLRSLQISIFVIAIGDVSMSQLSNIAGSQDRIFRVENFNVLDQTTETFVDSLCIPQSVDPSCSIDVGFGFDNSRTSLSSLSIFKDQKKLQTYLPEIIRYASVVNNLCCVRNPTINTNLGFRLVEDSGRILDDFSFEEYDGGIVKKVLALQTSRSLKFNTQLLRSFEEKFRASNSHVKVLIIFTDGLDEPVENLLQAVNSLKTSGVKALMIVALEGFKNHADLQRLEFGRGMYYKQLLSIGMQNVGSVMQNQIDTVASRECCNIMCKCSGHEGARGKYGRPGMKGLPGQRGLPGFPGEEGGPGERGLPGLNGTQGHQGCMGKRGVKGGRGYTGNTGDEGEVGLDGVNGEQGLTGASGSPGERGDPGSPGPRGISGNPGDPGQRGLRGDPGLPGLDNNSRGPKGDIGGPGIQGEPGEDGISGQIGDKGRPGPDGRRGSAGPLGPRGSAGAPGQPGLPGATGPLGAIGPPGPVGQKGYIGLPGPQGSPGSPGRPGSKGSSGSRGQKGQQGDPGDKGALGPPGPRGLPGKDGADGYGVSGTKGQKGDSGFPGYPGLQGERGFKGSSGGGGPKGNRGRAGNAGRPGQPGDPGSEGINGHRGPKGPRGTRQISDCQLISYVRDNCVCCRDNVKCPAYPTDLVIGLDMSEDVQPQGFERMRSVVLRLLDNIHIAESNCPMGARVAVVAYSSYTKYLIRFTDYRRKNQLIDAVNNIALERTSNRRNLGAAMRFVGRNVLKRVRKGILMRKVAIFLTAGESQDSTSLTTAILEYKALNIKLGVISLRNVPNIRKALEADETKSFILTVLVRVQDQNTTLSKVQSCVICFDSCRPARECDGTNLPSSPQELDVDLAVIVDGSRSILSDEYEGVKEVLGSVLDQIVVSSQPQGADSQARVALYQQSSTYSEAQSGVKTIFGFQQFPDRSLMKRSIYQDLQQTGGSSQLDLAMEYAIMQGILSAPRGRKNKMALFIIGEDMSSQDRAKLDFISNVAKCEGVVLFTLTLGDHISTAQVEQLASYPLEQHNIHLGHLKHGEHEYAHRFLRTFFHILSKNMNSYPHPSLKSQCSNFQGRPGQRPDYEAAERPVYRFLVPSTPYPEVAVEEQVEEEDVGVEEAEDQQNSGRGDSGVKSPFDSTDATEEIFQAKEETAFINDACFMKQDVGPCSDYVLSWHFDIQQKKCIYFWYGGCGGNENRFKTQVECEALCVRDI
ncbi:collagen alpha-6(VI) chain isoform X2 [Carassius auratus]|uniref:Collagen alpha-6(VI) chain isoform X2 n=1 Tax=Carassius auratus TaxID=7957 RepID=A0A6P6R1W8_CARAU|nr:collagen alpha-6(VI) chain-like isoform X2 [Carassius auratus]